MDVHDGLEVGVHLRARPEDAAVKVRAAYEAGCRRFDSTIGGYGSSAYAQDVMVGNLATETLLATLKEMGAELAGAGAAGSFGGDECGDGEAVWGSDAVARRGYSRGLRWGSSRLRV